MKVAYDIDFTITINPDWFGKDIRKNDGIILTSQVREISGKIKNVVYRVNQLRKLGIYGGDYSMLCVASGRDLEELGKGKAELCDELGVDKLYDDDDTFIKFCKKVTKVIKVEKGMF